MNKAAQFQTLSFWCAFWIRFILLWNAFYMMNDSKVRIFRVLYIFLSKPIFQLVFHLRRIECLDQMLRTFLIYKSNKGLCKVLLEIINPKYSIVKCFEANQCSQHWNKLYLSSEAASDIQSMIEFVNVDDRLIKVFVEWNYFIEIYLVLWNNTRETLSWVSVVK